jgi:hypothetical protein
VDHFILGCGFKLELGRRGHSCGRHGLEREGERKKSQVGNYSDVRSLRKSTVGEHRDMRKKLSNLHRLMNSAIEFGSSFKMHVLKNIEE